MRHGSLFSGIGGFDLAAQWMGWENVFQVEIDAFCQKVLEKNFPQVKRYGDIKKFNGEQYRGTIDILSGGFPCQDLSIAGEGKGITGNESSLWFDMYRVADTIRPSFLVIENSPELLKKGFEKVLYPLSEIGYDAEWHCVESNRFGGQQLRERVYIIAHSKEIGLQGSVIEPIFWKSILSQSVVRVSPGWRERRDIPQPRNFRSTYEVPNIVDRIKGLGNSIDTQVAFEIFKAIEQTHLAI